MREKYEAELKEERAAVEKLLDQRKQQVEMEMELNRLRLVLRQKDHDIEDLVQVRPPSQFTAPMVGRSR